MMLWDDGGIHSASLFSNQKYIEMKSEPRKTFQNLSAQKKDRITRAIVEEFAVKGFAGASINAIVGRLNIAKGSIFQYFGDKKGAFMYVFHHCVEMVKDYLRSVRDQSMDEDLPSRLKKTLSAGVGYIRRHPLLYRLYLNVMFDAKIPFREEILRSLRAYSLEFLESLLETAKSRGELKHGLDIKKTAFMLDAVMDRFLQARAVSHLDAGQGIYSSTRKQTENWIETLVDSMCSGILIQPDISASPPIQQNNSVQTPYILILSATEEEISLLINRIENSQTAPIAYRKAVSGRIGDVHVMVMITDPGLVNTAQAVTAAIEKKRPALVIQTGCCGAFKKSGLKIGDIAMATEEIDAQLGIESSNADNLADPLPFRIMHNQGGPFFHRYPVDARWLEKLDQPLSWLKKRGISINKGPFVTVSTITSSDDRARALFKRHGAIAEQMEGSAAAHVCALYEIPFIEIRGVSNMAGLRERQTWDIPLAAKNCSEAMILFIESMDPFTLK
jgi:futalosine hydrolase